MNDLNGFYNLSINPGQINIWYESLTPRRSSVNSMFDPDDLAADRKLLIKNFENNKHHGIISKQAKKKITTAINYLVYMSPPKLNRHPYYDRANVFCLNFITLTLSSSQIHSDNEIKSLLLEPFLNTCRKKWKVNYYIWRAEKQENGSLHFHICTNRFIPWNELRNIWNAYQQNLGYVTRYRENQVAWHRQGFRYRPELSKQWNRKAQVKAYKDGLLHDWSNPNSTDVHSLHHVSNVKAYFVKYLTKQEQNANIDGRLWGCSYNLTNLQGARTFAEGSAGDEIHGIMNDPRCKIYKADYFTVIYFPAGILSESDFPILYSLFQCYLSASFPDRFPAWFKSAA